MNEGYRFTHRLKVRYSEIDGQNHVYNAHYLTYIDIALVEYFEEGLKLSLQELAADEEFDYALVKSIIDYKGSARFGDWLTISVTPKAIGRTSFTMSYNITREADNAIILLGEIIYVNYNARTNSTVPVPNFIRQKIEEFENRTF